MLEGLTARVLARVGGERTLTDLRHIGEALRGSPSAAPRRGRPAGLAAQAGRRRQARGRLRADPPPRLRRGRRPARHDPRQQGPGVPRRLPPDPVGPLRRRDPAVPLFHDDEGAPLPRRRRHRPVPPRRPYAATGARTPASRCACSTSRMTRAQSQVVAWYAAADRNTARLPAAPHAVRASAGHAPVPDEQALVDDDRLMTILGRWQDGRRPAVELAALVPLDPTPLERVHAGAARCARSPATSTPTGAAPPTPRCRRPAPAHAAGCCPSPSSTPSSRGRTRGGAGPTAGALDDAGLDLTTASVPRRWRRCRSARPSARWSTRSSSTPTPQPPTSAPSCCGSSASSWSGGRSTSTRRARRRARRGLHEPARVRWPADRTLRCTSACRPAARARLRGAAGRRRHRDRAPRRRLGDLAPLLRRHLPEGDAVRVYADALDADPDLAGAVAARLPHRLDRRGAPPRRRRPQRFLTVDYKTNWLGPIDQPLTATTTGPRCSTRRWATPTTRSRPLLYTVVLHRYLRWRLPGYDPATSPRRRALPLPPRHVRTGDAARRRHAVRGVLVAAAGGAGRGAVRPARRRTPGGGDPVTEIFEPVDAHDARPRAGRHRAAARVQHRRRADRGRRPRRRHPRPARAARPTSRCCSRSRSPCAPCARVGVPRPRRRSPTRWPTSTWPSAGPESLVRGGRSKPARGRPGCVRWDHDLLYLDRYHEQETQVRRRPARARPGPPHDPDRIGPPRRSSRLQRASPRPPTSDEQVRGLPRAATQCDDRPHRRPGHRQDHGGGAACSSGWSTSEARGERLRIALAAPTGKAAARLQQAVRQEAEALRGGRPGAAGRRHRDDAAPAAAPATRATAPASATTAATACPTTWSSSTSRRWCR